MRIIRLLLAATSVGTSSAFSNGGVRPAHLQIGAPRTLASEVHSSTVLYNGKFEEITSSQVSSKKHGLLRKVRLAFVTV